MSGVYKAASSGDRRATLEAMRDVLAQKIDEGVPARDLAPLVNRLEKITAEIEQIAAPEDRSSADELAARRAERRSGVAGSSAKRRTTG